MMRKWSWWSSSIAAAAILVLSGLEAAAQERSRDFARKLERAGVMAPYFVDVVHEVASGLAQAAPGKWRSVQVNQPHRAGSLNIYMIDATRLPEGGVLADEGVENLTPDNLRAGALAHEASGTIFLNTAMWRRLIAATVLVVRDKAAMPVALATVDVKGLAASRDDWDEATLRSNRALFNNVGIRTRGALAFVLAHEMGHLQIGRTMSDEPDRIRLSNMTEREKDEARACPELMEREARQRQTIEREADLAAAAMLGKQCLGAGGDLRYQIYMLGTTVYFLAAMSDKLIDMGRNSDSPNIAAMLRRFLGPDLYERVIAAHAAEKRRGAVAFAFPSSHPPDTARMQAIEATLRDSPCGASGFDSTSGAMLELLRRQTCQGLTSRERAR